MHTASHNRRRHLVRAAFWALLAAGIGVRVFGAWCYRHGLNVDHAIISLMAKRMAEFREFPVFFYGQAYMGSLEPLFCAAACRLLGFSGFAVCLGTAFLGVLLLIALYHVGKRLAGPAAGLAAMAYGIIGPKGYFHYQASPRCYSVLMLLTLLILWQAAVCVGRARDHRAPPPAGDLALLGLLAGLGWWASSLILFPVLTAGLVLVLFLHRRLLTWRLAAGAAGFLAGSLPWWVWNAGHGFRSLRQTNSLQPGAFIPGLQAFFGDRLVRILQLGDLPAPLRWAALALYAAALAAVIRQIIESRRRVADPARQAALAGLLLFVPVSAVIYSLTEFAAFDTARYHLPLIPLAALALGVLTARLARRLSPWVCWLPLAALAAGHVPNLPRALAMERADAAEAARYRPIEALCERTHTDVVYADFMQRWMNAASRERIAFVPINGRAYLPGAERAETARRVGVLDGYIGLTDFLRASGGTAACDFPGNWALHTAFAPPAGGLEPVDPALLAAATAAGSPVPVDTLADDRLDTGWQPPPEPLSAVLELTLAEPVTLHAVRLVPGSNILPARWSLQGRDEGEEAWRDLVPDGLATPWFWSGDRPYLGGLGQRLEARFEPTRCRALRLVIKHRRSRKPWSIAELRLFAPAPAPAAPAAAWEAVPPALAAGRIRRLYADRWEAARAREAGLWTPDLDLPQLEDRPPAYPPLAWTPGTAILVRHADAPACRRALARAGLAAEEEAVGPWLLLRAAAPGPAARLAWAGWGLLDAGRGPRPAPADGAED